MEEKDKHSARIFYVDSRFERLARRPGGVTREQALSQAQDQVDTIKPTFGEWLDPEMERLRDAVTRIDADPADAAALDIAEVTCGQIHDIAATMGYKLVTFVAGSLRALIESLKDGAAYDKEMVDCHVAALFLVRTRTYRHLHPDEVPEMTRGLRSVAALSQSDADRKKS